MTQLEHLHFEGNLSNKSLACLAGLKNLRTLDFSVSTDDGPMLKFLPALPRLEAVGLTFAGVGDDDLRYLAALPNLKSLCLGGGYTDVTAAGLAELATLESLEELEIDNELVSEQGLESLLAIKRLKNLHIKCISIPADDELMVDLTLDDGSTVYVQESELDRCRRALAALRRSKPGLVIDGGESLLGWKYSMVPFDYDTFPDHHPTWLPGTDEPWMTLAQRASVESWAAKNGLPTSF